jgi:hypothetical protein
MATVIDSLVVKLGLDNSEFKAGAKETNSDFDRVRANAKRTGKSIEQDGQKGAEFFHQLRKSALQFFAVLTVGRGLSAFTSSVINSGAQLDRMSKNLGTTADRLSRWQGAVRQSGGTAEGALGSFQSLNASLTELKLTGNTGILPYLQALGVSLSDASGKARPLEDILMDVGDSLKRIPNREDAYNIGRNLGIDEGTVNLLMRSRSEIKKLLDEQKGYSNADAEAARKAQENWEKTKIKIEQTTQKIVIALIPALEQIAESMFDIAEVATPLIKNTVDGFNSINKATDGWLLTLGLVLVALKGATGLIGGVAAGAAGLAKFGVIGAAGAGGYAVGGLISKELEGTEMGNSIGRATAQVLAFFGNKEAQAALDAEAGVSSIKPSSSAPSKSGGKLSRAERNNNPGNLNFAGQRGATLESGSGARFAKFGSMQEGVAGLVRQLKLYGSRGLDTIQKIISKYAPSSENDTGAYISKLAKDMGIGATDKLNLDDPNVMAGLVRGISTHEAGKNFLSDQHIMSGLQMAGMSGGNTVSIGEVKVYTQATDASGIARDLNNELIRQADAGLR